MKKTTLIIQLLLCFSVFTALSIFLYPDSNESTFTVTDIPSSDAVVSDTGELRIVGHSSETEVLVYTEKVKRGGTAELSFRGTANETYYIRVYYSSGLSSSKSLSPVKADEQGIFGWSWKISPNVSPGDIRIIVTSESARIDLKMNVY